MNANKITVFGTPNAGTHTFTADPNKHLRAILGKHGQLCIMQVEVHEDVDIETKKQLETVTYVIVYNPRKWTSYVNEDVTNV